MSTTYPATLRKEERICSRKLIDEIFSGSKSRSVSAFPLRVVYMPIEEGGGQSVPVDNGEGSADNGTLQAGSSPRPKAKMLVSVPKRYFKRAVKRNRVKRQVREAYRKNKGIIADKAVALAFIWTDHRLHDSSQVERKVVNLLTRVKEKLEKGQREQDTQPNPQVTD